MNNNYTIIDPTSWERALHCQIFRHYANPQYCISLELDVTSFYKKVKENNWSFTLAMIYAVTKCANEIEEFRYRFLDGNIVLYDKIDTSFTYLNKETELFKVINVPMQETIEAYILAAQKQIQNQKEYFTGPMGVDIYQFSALPWISYTHVSHTDSGKADASTPLFDWGKFISRDQKLILPFSVQVHHSFVDGIHIGKLVDKLQEYLSC